MSKRVMVLMSIVECDKGKKLIKVLENIGIKLNFQLYGFGTAPTEMMDIFGLGSKDKDVLISLANEDTVKDMMKNFGIYFESHTKYGGLMIIMKTYGASRVLAELLSYHKSEGQEEGEGAMKNEHHNNLIVISVNEGYSESVMQTARKAGATGGTVLKGRLADIDIIAELKNTEIDDEREILLILAPLNTSKQIMEDVNREFGISSKANAMVFAVPTEKAYKI